MTIDDKRAWLEKHGENRGEGWTQAGHHVLWRPAHLKGRSRYHDVGQNSFKGLGRDSDEAFDDLFKQVKSMLHRMCV